MIFLGRRPLAALLFRFTIVVALGLGVQAAAQDLSAGPKLLRRIEAGGPVDVKQLAASSSLIVRGRVIKGAPRLVGRTIYTFYDVAVQETVKGLPRAIVSVAVPGGAIGNVQLIVPEVPAFARGDELVFFGRPFDREPSAFQPTGAVAGLVRILSSTDKGAVVAPRGRPEGLKEFLEEVRTLSTPR